MRRSYRPVVLVVLLPLLATACSGLERETETPTSAGGVSTTPVDSEGRPIPPAPAHRDGPLADSVRADLDLVFADPVAAVDLGAFERLAAAGDVRVAWLFSDLLRFYQHGKVAAAVEAAFELLTGTSVDDRGFTWGIVTDWLIAWNLPAPPGYVDWKRRPFEAIEPAWAPFFDDSDAAIDWRWLSWGGVYIDNRPLAAVSAPCPRGCIPALDDPAVTDAAGGSWYGDHRIVFGVVVNGEARAYPKHIMEVHEMVNDTLGGRRIAVPYCTLCGSAQAYFTDAVPAEFSTLELRTTGLLSRSNKVTFDLGTFSLFDTFTGRAVSGPLQGLTLEMISVRTSTWGEWKSAHPETTIVAQDGGIGRLYSDDPLEGRDAAGPIFPIGPVDTRLPIQEQVLGVINGDGLAVAFPVAASHAALIGGRTVSLAGIEVRSDGAGLTAWEDDAIVASHQAFWFAWSQFHPATVVWTPLADGS